MINEHILACIAAIFTSAAVSFLLKVISIKRQRKKKRDSTGCGILIIITIQEDAKV